MAGLRLFLFDLDGTLVSTGGAGLRALDRTFDELYGIKDVVKTVDPRGKTDPAIFREVIRRFLSRELDANEMTPISEAYLRHLSAEIDATRATRALAGVVEFVGHLATRPDIAIALGTGNLERGARIKLSPTRLNEHFLFGGFGSDAEDRSDVLIAGHRRAEERRQKAIPPPSVFVIGDTTLDVAAAREAGYQAVAVASGTVTIDELKAARPDFLMRDMTEAFEWLEQLDSFSGAVNA
jgi:phosphoglycolate phosphatase-like HAD superfamily hydrolase